MKQHLKNGRLLCGANQLDEVADLFIVDQKIVATHNAPDGFAADVEIDASDRWVIPGLIDLAANCREPGSEQKGTITSETYAAVSGGITSICCPADTLPIIDTPSVVELIQERAKDASAKIYPIGALTQGLQGTALSEMAALKKAGCRALGNAKHPIADHRVLYRAFEYAATFALPVFFDAQDYYLAKGGCMHEGFTSHKLGLNGIPVAAETIALHTALQLAQTTGVTLHISRISSKAAVELIRATKQAGLALTCDVAIHHLYLTDQDDDGYNNNYHVLPPLRSLDDQQALLAGLDDGTIDAICSDHSPHEQNAKLTPFSESAPGISGLETLLPLTVELQHKTSSTILDLLSHVTCKPAQIIGVQQGQITPNTPADLALFNPQTTWQLTPDNQRSQGKNTPFHGWPLQGQVEKTWVSGQMEFDIT